MAVCEMIWNDVGAHYAQAAAGSRGPSAEGHTVLVRRDGEVVAFGYNGGVKCDVPALPLGTQYVQAAAGGHTVLLRSDGEAVAFGDSDDGRSDVPTSAAHLSMAVIR